MSKHIARARSSRSDSSKSDPVPLSMQQYRDDPLQLQERHIGCADRILVILEGRDCASKDGVIKRIVRHLSPRETRVVALGSRQTASKRDPLKQWKASPIDHGAVKIWKRYSAARDAMLVRIQTPEAPWTIVGADDKRLARVNLIHDLLGRPHYADKNKRLEDADVRVVFLFEVTRLGDGSIA